MGSDLEAEVFVASLFSDGFGFGGRTLTGLPSGGGGRRVVLRLTFVLSIVPYFGADSRGSSPVQRTWISRVTSDKIWRSYKL